MKVSFDTKSIENAIKYLQRAKQVFKSQVCKEYIKKSLKEIQKIADKNLGDIRIGSSVYNDIIASWDIIVTKDKTTGLYKGTLINTSEKAVYIEFGTGLLGELDPHPNAEQSEYQYNINTHGLEGYLFTLDGADKLDIDQGETMAMWWSKSKNKLKVRTRGGNAQMYLYKAAMEYVTSGRYKQVWETIKAKGIKKINTIGATN